MNVIEVQNLHVFAGYFSLPENLAYQRGRELLDFFALSSKKNAKVMVLFSGTFFPVSKLCRSGSGLWPWRFRFII